MENAPLGSIKTTVILLYHLRSIHYQKIDAGLNTAGLLKSSYLAASSCFNLY